MQLLARIAFLLVHGDPEARPGQGVGAGKSREARTHDHAIVLELGGSGHRTLPANSIDYSSHCTQ
jgi:hypothetical protein